MMPVLVNNKNTRQVIFANNFRPKVGVLPVL
jgi:hypothetical protein